MKIEINSIHIALITTLFMGIFLLVQKANALSSPSIEKGSNPIISSSCTSTYTVPVDQILVITDFVAYGTSSSYYGSASIEKDGASLINIGGFRVDNPASIGSFHTGFKAEQNTLISCSTTYATLSWSGYLARP
jgi:hypothetical protein